MACTSGTGPVCLVHLVSLIDTNKPDRPNKPNEQDGRRAFSATCYEFHPDNTQRCAISGVKLPTSSETLVITSSASRRSSKHS